MTDSAEVPRRQGTSGSVECKLCGADTLPLMVRNEFPIIRCTRCGFMFAVVPDDYDLTSTYCDEAYWTGAGKYGQPEYEAQWKLVVRFYLARLSRIASFQKPGRLLEIGCASGHLLYAAQGAGWKVTGVELSELMRRRAAKRVSCDIFSTLEEVSAQRQRFDCIVLFEVIEHVAGAVAFLNQVRQLMAPGALLALSTPNSEGPAAVRDPEHKCFCAPVHVSYFAPRTLSTCVERAGFKLLALEGLFTPEEMPIPAPIATLLRPFRRGKRLRPHGLLGRLIKAYQHSRPDALCWTDTLELYARRTD